MTDPNQIKVMSEGQVQILTEIEDVTPQIHVEIQGAGPQGKPGKDGFVWLPTIDESNVITWIKDDGEIQPDSISMNELSTIIDYEEIKETTTYTHEQAQAIKIWLINHNLNYYPSVSITTYGGTTIIGAVKYIDKNNLTVEFTVEVAGYAHLS